MALNQAAEARAVQEWSRLSLAEKIPMIRREVEIREEVPEYQSRFGVAIDKELEAAGERFAPRAGDSPADYHNLIPDEQALFTIALNADYIPPDHAYVGPVREQTMRLDAERLTAEFGAHPAAHQAAFNKLERERPWDHAWYKDKQLAGELPEDHPFAKPAQLALNNEQMEHGAAEREQRVLEALSEERGRFLRPEHLTALLETREELRQGPVTDRAVAIDQALFDHGKANLELAYQAFDLKWAEMADNNPPADRQLALLREREQSLGGPAATLDTRLTDHEIAALHLQATQALAPLGYGRTAIAEHQASQTLYPDGDGDLVKRGHILVADYQAGHLDSERAYSHPLDDSPQRDFGGLLAEAQARYRAVQNTGSEYDWRNWSKMDHEERLEVAAEYAADPNGRGRTYEAPVAHFNMMEAGKAHFDTLDKAQQEEIKREFLSQKGAAQDRNPYHQAVYLDIAKSDLPIGQMPLGAIIAGENAGLQRFAPENLEQERAQARWDRLSATTKAAYVVQYAHDGKLPAHEREREYAAQAARFDWTKESAALAKEWEKLSPEQRKEELDAYKAALATPRHPYEHHIRAEFANELKGLAEHGPQFPGLANVRELKGRDAVSQEVGARAAYSSPAPTTPGAVALNPKAAAALDRIGRQSSAGLDNAGASARASRAPKLKPVELGER